jgi:hypothetical protein
MSVRFYQFGALVGGTDDHSHIIPPITANFGAPEQFEGTIGAIGTTITFTSHLKHIRIANTHDSASLEYSFDGATWFTLIPYQILQEQVNSNVVYLRPLVVGTNPTYELLGIRQE